MSVTTKINIYYQPEINKVNKAKYLLAMERAYSIIDNTQNSFVIRNNFATKQDFVHCIEATISVACLIASIRFLFRLWWPVTMLPN